MAEWREMSNRIQDFLRLRTLPLGFKFLEKAEDLGKIERVRRPEQPLALCQVVGISRHLGWTMGVTIDNLSMPECILKLGFAPRFGPFLDGTSVTGIWTKDQKDGAKYSQTLPHLPAGKYKALVISPLGAERIDPDIALIFGNSAQMCLLMNALQWEDYERLQFFFSGEGSCADTFAECYHSGKPQLTVPCLGERLQGSVQEDELEIAIPAGKIRKAVDGLDAMRAARSISYPIPYYGLQLSTAALMARTYPGLQEALALIKEKARK